MPITTEGVIAIVGAAAWLPQIGKWIYNSVTRPTLTLIPDKNSSIGFNDFGPIFNVQMVMAVDRKDVIVTELGITLKHENGDEHHFLWQGMTETFSGIRDRYGIRQGSFEKDQAAIALKVNTVGITERFVLFQEDQFHKRKSPIFTEANRHWQYLSGRDNAADEFLASEKCHNLINVYKESFWWRAGAYEIAFTASGPRKMRIAKHKFHMELTQADVEALNANVGLIPRHYEHLLKQGLEGYDGSAPIFAWRNPQLMNSAFSPSDTSPEKKSLTE